MSLSLESEAPAPAIQAAAPNHTHPARVSDELVQAACPDRSAELAPGATFGRWRGFFAPMYSSPLPSPAGVAGGPRSALDAIFDERAVLMPTCRTTAFEPASSDLFTLPIAPGPCPRSHEAST